MTLTEIDEDLECRVEGNEVSIQAGRFLVWAIAWVVIPRPELKNNEKWSGLGEYFGGWFWIVEMFLEYPKWDV